MHNDPNYYKENINFKKITITKKLFAEIINIMIILVITFILFNLIGKKVIRDSWAKDYVDNINVIFNEITEENNIPVKINNEYGFLDIDESLFIEKYKEENNVSNEKAFEMFLEVRLETYSKIRENETFRINNSKFNTIYFLTYGLILFLPVFIFEFLIIVFSKKSSNIGMMIYKQSIVNSIDNNMTNKLKLILRFFIIYLLEHMLLRLFFGNLYFIVLLLAHLILVFPTKNKVFLHDIFSFTKVIEQKYIGYTE